MTVVKIIEVIGSSPKGFEDAVKEALSRAAKTVRNITGVDVVGCTLTVEKGEIISWNVNVKIAFTVEE
jgi:flavin-binding protein dodecin